ncbi:Adenylate kinase [Frankliniella fusca]|uniref:Adenylate kinase n=1 Tax=Frankliniella fusca TaxID=407009 RepID=A0AAE1H3D5_9NEOP|nr:Adenylate kinase [Frankliniella fusca]
MFTGFRMSYKIKKESALEDRVVSLPVFCDFVDFIKSLHQWFVFQVWFVVYGTSGEIWRENVEIPSGIGRWAALPTCANVVVAKT